MAPVSGKSLKGENVVDFPKNPQPMRTVVADIPAERLRGPLNVIMTLSKTLSEQAGSTDQTATIDLLMETTKSAILDLDREETTAPLRAIG